MTNNGSLFRTALFTVVAMLAFAANSVLCRLALGGGAIDAASFTSIRIIAGATILIPLTLRGPTPISWQPPTSDGQGQLGYIQINGLDGFENIEDEKFPGESYFEEWLP